MKIADHKATPWVITDFETGGYEVECNPKTGTPTVGLTEIAMLAIHGDSLEEIGRYETLIKPYGLSYDDVAFEKTGLSLAKLEKEGKPMETVFKEVCEFLELANVHRSKSQYKPVLVGQNVAFECKCWQHLFFMNKRLKDLDKYFQCQNDFSGNPYPNTIDTLQLGRMRYAANIRMKSFTLESICERAGVAMADGHRAMNDVIPTTELLRDTIRSLRQAEGMAVTKSDDNSVGSFRNSFKFEY